MELADRIIDIWLEMPADLHAQILRDPEFWCRVESPIEQLFVEHWLAECTVLNAAFGYFPFRLMPQVDVCLDHRLAPYRLDFSIGVTDRFIRREMERRGTTLSIAVELDGHDFHERTPEQVAHRDQRDRDLQLAGWRVFHYSGSELIRRRGACAVEVLKASRLALDAALARGCD